MCLSEIIDTELKICYNTIEKMAILETQKFIEIINILLNFISKYKIYPVNNSNMQTFSFNLENTTNEILLNTENCKLSTYDSKRNKYNYQKANKIYKNCLRIFIKIYFYISKNVFKFQEKMITSHQIKNLSPKKKKIKKPKKVLSKQTTLKSNMISNSKVNEIQNKLKSAIKAEIDKYKFIIYNLYINSLESLSKKLSRMMKYLMRKVFIRISNLMILVKNIYYLIIMYFYLEIK